ncbi:MAG: PspC domain-containing protein [Pseudomonadota bacterium]|nr:PspC domain-containing protein [Pseudomonadota bacterium]
MMKFPQTDKRIYRDTSNGVISGVCAGLAKYLDVDATWVRVAAVAGLILFHVPVLIAYIAATFLLPRWA